MVVLHLMLVDRNDASELPRELSYPGLGHIYLEPLKVEAYPPPLRCLIWEVLIPMQDGKLQRCQAAKHSGTRVFEGLSASSRSVDMGLDASLGTATSSESAARRAFCGFVALATVSIAAIRGM